MRWINISLVAVVPCVLVYGLFFSDISVLLLGMFFVVLSWMAIPGAIIGVALLIAKHNRSKDGPKSFLGR